LSHFTKISTQFKHAEHLMAALRALGYKLELNAFVRGWRGISTRAELVVVRPNGFDIGFQRTPEGSYEIVADWYGVDVPTQTPRDQRQDAFVRALRQEYSAIAAEAGLRKAGVTGIRREQRPDGTIVVLGQKIG
jgi:hypothetical protein